MPVIYLAAMEFSTVSAKITAENRPVIFSAAMEFSVVSMKITAGNKIIFSGHVIAAESFAIFAGHAKLTKRVVFSAETVESNLYFWRIIFNS
jgi:hypothetical protein